MFANNYISTVVENQLPDFIRADDAQKGPNEPSFTKLLKKYYEYLEQSDKTVKVGKQLYDYMDVDTTRADLLKYFKTKFIPSFPEVTELSKEKIIKAARDFYAKKGTAESFKFLFRILYDQDISIYFPKEDVLRASDGKWKLPQALRLSIAETSRFVPGGNVNVANITANVVTANGYNLATTGIAANSYIKIGNERRQVVSINALGDKLTVNIPFANVTGNTLIYNSSKLYRLIPNEFENFDFNLLERRKGTGEISRTTCVIEKAVKTVDKNSGREIAEIYVSNVTRLFEAGEYLIVEYEDENGDMQEFRSKIVSAISNINLYRNRFGVVQAGKRYLTGDPVVLFGGLNPDSDEAEKAVAFVGNVTNGSIESLALNKDGYYFRAYQNGIIRILTSSGIGGNVLIEGIWEDAPNSEVFSFSTDAIVYKKDIALDDLNGYDFDNVTAYVNLTSGAGNTTTTINLNTSGFIASSVNDYYNSSYIKIVDGTGSNEFVNNAIIIDYDGTTKIATLDTALTVPVDGTSNVFMYVEQDTTLQRAFSYDEIRLGKIRLLNLEDGGSFFEEPPGFEAISVYDSDFVKDAQSVLNNEGFLIIPTGQFDDYRPEATPPSINISSSNVAYSTANGFYNNCRLFLDVGQTAHYREIVDYVVNNVGSPSLQTKTIYLDAPFESNIDNINIQNFAMYMDFRPNVRGLGKLGVILVNNGGEGYSATDQIVFDGTGYDAAATLTVSGGVITEVTLTNRGEGYYESPGYRIVNSSGGPSAGANAQLTILGLSDGEEIVAETEEIGKILSFDIVNRGFDYANTPITSLKVVDVLTDNLLPQTIVIGGNTVWQGSNTSNTLSTFNGIIDEIYRPDSTNTVIRVFNYNGRINVAQSMYIATSAGNVAINVYNTNAIISFNDFGVPVEKPYPLYYGNGLAKANAEFLRGLIKYDGFYLNTDGFLSSDKKLQNKDYYHNYSYEIQSEKTLTSFKDTVKPIAHPAGMQLLAKYLINNIVDSTIGVSSNIHVTNTTLVTNCNTSFSSNVVYGNSSNFGTTANIGDIIVINTTSTLEFKKYSRVITYIDAANDIIWLERPVGGIGDGRFLANTGNANVFVTLNTSPITESLEVGDNVSFNIAGTVYNRYVVEFGANNRVKLNAVIANSGNSLYVKTPTFNAVAYEIISTNG